MILIAHRGNTVDPNRYLENHPDYIEAALHKGYECEVDVWYEDGTYFLGHDEPSYKTTKEFLQRSSLWCHAKNLEAINEMSKYPIHYFWHQEDDITLMLYRKTKDM